MTAAKSKNTEACKLVEVSQSEDDREKYERRSEKLKERTEELKKKRVKKKEKIHDLLVFEEDGAEFFSKIDDRNLSEGKIRRGSKIVFG